MTRTYGQGVASLGFDGGPSVTFRLNPTQVDWNFTVDTSVIETVGGRVVQVLGASLSDLVIRGSFGEQRGKTYVASRTMAESFLSSMKQMAEWQSRDATTHAPMHQPAVFNFAPKGWRFAVYVKDLTDPSGGGSILHSVGRASYDYALTLAVYADLSDTAQVLGRNNGVLETMKDKAIQGYMDRIADGIGWRFTEYNGHGVAETVTDQITVGGAPGKGNVTASTAATNKQAAMDQGRNG